MFTFESILQRWAVRMVAIGFTLAVISGVMPLTTITHAEPNVDVSASGISWLASNGPGAISTKLGNMLPSDSFVGRLTISNQNNFAVRYSLTTSANNPDGKNLREQLMVEIKTAGTNCNQFDGQLLYHGSLGDTALGDPAFGAQPGDRQLAAHTSEVLCLRLTFPLSSGNAFMGATTSATMALHAEQIP